MKVKQQGNAFSSINDRRKRIAGKQHTNKSLYFSNKVTPIVAPPNPSLESKESQQDQDWQNVSLARLKAEEAEELAKADAEWTAVTFESNEQASEDDRSQENEQDLEGKSSPGMPSFKLKQD